VEFSPEIPFHQTSLGLWVPVEQEAQPQGSELPLLIAERLQPDPGTLLLAAKRTEPAETKAFFTEEEIDPARGIRPLSREELIELLKLLPREPIMVILGRLLKRLSQVGHDTRGQLEMAKEIYEADAPVVTEMARFCATEDHVIFSEQGFFSLLAHAVVYCRPSDETKLRPDEITAFRRVILAAPSLLRQDGELPEYDPEKPEAWLAYLVQNILFNAHPNFGSGLARTWRIIGELGRDSNRERKSPADLRSMLSECPLDLEQQLGLAFGLFSILQGDEVIFVESEHWRDICQRVAPHLDSEVVIAQIAATSEEMKEELAGPQAKRLDPFLRWATIPFLERPFLRLRDDRLLLVSPRALESWPTDGVHYRLLRKAGELDPKKGAQHFTALIGELTETYVVELLEIEFDRTRQKHLNVGTVHKAAPLGDGESTDVFIVQGADLIVLEISSSRITAPTRLSGNEATLKKDLDKVVTKRVEQLNRTIEGPRRSEVTLAGVKWNEISRVFPVVVNIEPIRWTGPMHAYLVKEASGLLQQDKVQPLQFLEIEDLEAALSVVGPRTMADLLTAKIQSVGVDPDIQHWFHGDVAAPKPDRPQVVKDLLERSFDTVLKTLGFDLEAV
jgi:hypothetical protein